MWEADPFSGGTTGRSISNMHPIKQQAIPQHNLQLHNNPNSHLMIAHLKDDFEFGHYSNAFAFPLMKFEGEIGIVGWLLNEAR